MSLAQSVVAELEDPRFRGLIHGTRNAAAVGGCHGPLCRKYHRDKRRKARAASSGRPMPEPTSDDQYLAQIIVAHTRRVLMDRAAAQVRDVRLAHVS